VFIWSNHRGTLIWTLFAERPGYVLTLETGGGSEEDPQDCGDAVGPGFTEKRSFDRFHLAVALLCKFKNVF
jgi:hypothetical protein